MSSVAAPRPSMGTGVRRRERASAIGETPLIGRGARSCRRRPVASRAQRSASPRRSRCRRLRHAACAASVAASGSSLEVTLAARVRPRLRLKRGLGIPGSGRRLARARGVGRLPHSAAQRFAVAAASRLARPFGFLASGVA